MKNKLAKSAVVLLSATAIFSAGLAANGLVSSIQAELHKDLNIIIDGKDQTFADANGSPVYPIMYNGTTYLPVRAIGNIMGKDVGWDESTQTITLTAPTYTLGGTLIYEDENIELRYKKSYIEYDLIWGDDAYIIFTLTNKTNSTIKLYMDSISFNGISYNGFSSNDTVAPKSKGIVVFENTILGNSEREMLSTFNSAAFETISGEMQYSISDSSLLGKLKQIIIKTTRID